MIDVVGNVKAPTVLPFRPEKINAFLGIDISKEEMAGYLETIEFKVDLDKMEITVPSFRPDIEAEADVAEEVARFYGYNKIPTTLIANSETTKGSYSPIQKFRKDLGTMLTSQGMYEIYTFTFIGENEFDKLNLPKDSAFRNAVKIRNPLGEDTSIMRTTMLASMLETLSYNYNRKNEEARLFEISKAYIPTEKGQLPNEPEKLAIGMYGKDMDFFDLKGAVEEIIDGLNIKNITWKPLTTCPTLHPGRSAALMVGDKQIGILGQVHPTVCKNFDMDKNCFVAEIDVLPLFENVDENIKYKALPKFPAAERDIAVLVDKTALVGDLEATIAKASGALLENIKLFDVYEGDRIPEDKKSVAFAISFRAADRSLTSEEVNKVFNKIVKDLQFKNNAQLR